VRPYAERITSLGDTAIRGVAPGEFVHPYLGPRPGVLPAAGPESRVLLVIGPDKGLCGPLVSNLVRKMLEEDNTDSQLITVGKRVEAPAARIAGRRLVASFPVGSKLPEFSLVYDLVLAINGLIFSGKAGRLDVLYTRFISYFTQVPTVDHLLPLVLGRSAAGQKPVAPLGPASGPALGALENERPHTIEPDLPGLLEALLPHYLEVRLFDAVIQAYSSEHGARMVAMQNAKKNALEIADSFTLLYNKTRQERITNEILDLANTGKRA
jgi:F-type H+-transporting ATPase subunit gamma